jgi:hypothetical protein
MATRSENGRTRIPSPEERPDLWDYYNPAPEPDTGGIKLPKSVLELLERLKAEEDRQK